MGKDVSRDLIDRQLGRALGRKIARLERHVRELETASQAAHRSVEDGAVDFYDDNDVLRERIGKQADGSFGRLTVDGPVPPAPTEPDVVVIDNGVVAITWDGRCEEKWPFAEFRNVRVHLDDTADFTPTRRNQVGSIHAHRGGTIVAVTESDDDNPIYVRLVAVSTAGHVSDPSPAVLVDELDEDDYEDEQEELEWEDGDGHTLTAGDIAAGSVTFGLSHDPEVESLLAWWHPGGISLAGVPQTRGEAFTVNWQTAQVTWTLPDRAREGDRLRVYYPYFSGATVQVSYESSGWKWLQIASSDSTDRSAPGFDDSGWSTGTAAFGSPTSGPTWDGSTAKAYGWPPAATPWTNGTALWLRRAVGPISSSNVVVQVRVDNQADIYWNGTFIANSGELTETAEIAIPAALLDDVNVLAVRAYDLGVVSYLDVRVEAR